MPYPPRPGAARMRRVLLVGFAVTMIAVGLTAQLALGGPDTVENLQVLCLYCNTDKGCSIQ